MGNTKPGRRYMVSRETVQDILEAEQAAWADMGRKIREGAPASEQYALWLEHAAELAARREQAATGNFTELSIEAIRGWMQRFGRAV